MVKSMFYYKRIILTLLLIATVAMFASPSFAADESLKSGFVNPPDEARPSAYWLWLNGYVNRDHMEKELKSFYDTGIRGLCIFDMGARGAASCMPPEGPAFMSKQSAEDVAHAVRLAGQLGMDVELSAASSWDMGGSWVEPKHASMGLFRSQISVKGPKEIDQVLPFPEIPSKAPRLPDGTPAYWSSVAVLAVPAERRAPGYDFTFKLDPPGIRKLTHAILYNSESGNPNKDGEYHSFAKDFTIAVSTTTADDSEFREVFSGTLKPEIGPQRFELPEVDARYVRLRLIDVKDLPFDYVQLAEFELYDTEGFNVVASHGADRSRDGADLLGYPPALGWDRNWTAANLHDGSKSGAGGSWCSAGLPPAIVEDPSDIIDLTDKVDAAGRLRWNAPSGEWEIIRYVCANTGERLKVPSPQSDGLATDHFSAEATTVFLKYIFDRLEAELGDLDQTALKYLYLASYEVRGMIWTPEMLKQFRKYRGYDMTPFLPALSGNIVGSEDITNRFIYDYRKTLGDLLVDAYYKAAVDASHAAGLGVESEAGGPGPPIHQVPVDALKAQGTLDEVRGEFWPHRPQADNLWVVKETACAAHTYGKRRVHMEAFTSMYHWEDGPFDLKPSADRAFCEGMNHVVWHTGAHQPPEAGKPGWVYGAGTHINTNLIWWDKADAFIDYLSRCSYMLQQGNFVADACYYYGDQGYNFVPPKHIDPALGFGRDYDVVNAEVLTSRMSVADGKIVLPEGTEYPLLILPDREDIDLDVLRKLEELVRAGATIIGPKPKRSGGLADHVDRDREVRKLADQMWGDCDGRRVVEHAYGKGRIVWGRTPKEILMEQRIGPDFDYFSEDRETRLDFIHRRTDESDIYFVSNKRMQGESVIAQFRVFDAVPSLWLPESGEIVEQVVFEQTADGIRLPLELAEAGSAFVVFTKSDNEQGPHLISMPAQLRAARTADGDISVTADDDGTYRLKTSDDQAIELKFEGIGKPAVVSGPWTIRFLDGRGAPEQVTWDELKSWTEAENPGVRYYSGRAVYETEFTLSESWTGADRAVTLDLGNLWTIGEVRVNGRSAGIVWKPPYSVDVTELARPGQNRLEIEVANTWANRLVGDANSPEDQRYCRTNVTRSGTPGRAWKDVPLRESGLLGPVRLVPSETKTLNLKR